MLIPDWRNCSNEQLTLAASLAVDLLTPCIGLMLADSLILPAASAAAAAAAARIRNLAKSISFTQARPSPDSLGGP